jgi:tetratricopeptide (TPR) repeat protein
MTEESLFALALERPSGPDRQTFLDAACGDDPLLRERVERLLAADDRSRGILERRPDPADVLAACLSDTPSLDRPTGTPQFGDGPRSYPVSDPPGYELAERVGEGGMGVVYRARDTRLDRDVAVKFLQARFAADGPAARRFLGEARVTAQLQHPGVPPVHQVGAMPDGRPFLAMKLIAGATLDRLLKDRPDPAHDRGRFVAEFEQVCQAVACAHAHKVVHRDLKPSNVMVGAFGEVQVMDWGLAKVLPGTDRGPGGDAPEDAADLAPVPCPPTGDPLSDKTRTGSVLGTPSYMPPEQAVGAVDRVDERSDVFGLGAILCDVLTGRPPYAGADFESVRQSAARGSLGDAFARLDACGADPGLVELCKRCLAPEKADRPADAGEVARAVAGLRDAADERARVAELDRVRAEGERAKAEAEAREQRKRRRVQLALAAALGLLLAAGGAFAWYSDRQAAERRIEEEVRARNERARLAQNARAVAALLDDCENDLRADRADRAGVALGAAERRAADGGAEELAGRLARRRADLTLLRALIAADKFRWTWDEDTFPDSAAVAALWQAALAGYGVTADESRAAEAAGKVNESPVRDRVLTTLDELLAFDGSAGVRAVLRFADPDPFRDAARDALVAGNGPGLTALAGRPEALTQPRRFAAAFGQLRAIPAKRKRAILETALRGRPADLGLLMALDQSYMSNRPEWAGERVRWCQAALAADPGNHAVLNNLGLALKAAGDLDGAIAAYREAVRIDPDFAVAHSNLGVALGAAGDPDGAIAAHRAAIRADPTYATPHNNLGVVFRDAKRDQAAAVAAFKEAVRIDPKYANAHNNLGVSLRAVNDPEGAMAAYRAAVRANPDFASAHLNLGLMLRDVKRDPDGAIAAFREAVRADPKFARAHFNLGNALWVKKEPDGAIAALRAAVRADPKHAAAHINLGNALSGTGDPDGAVAAFRAAVRADPMDARAHNSLGVTLCDVMRDYYGAAAAFREAVRLNPKDAKTHFNLGNALRGNGDVNGAIAAVRDAIRLNPRLAFAHNGLGVLLCDEKQDYDGAVAAFEEAVRLDPKFANGHFNLGNALRGRGDLDAAMASFTEAMRLDPKDPDARNNLAWILAAGPDRVRDGRRAVGHATRACELSGWKHPVFISTLAAAHAEVGEFDRAVVFQTKALTFPDYEKRHGEISRVRLQSYAQKTPYRDPTLTPREVAPPPRVVKP